MESENEVSNFERKWILGNCNGYPFESDSQHIERCCLMPGRHVLICRNSKTAFGWGNAFIEIQGQKYCDDFIGNEARRIVTITGNVYNLKHVKSTMFSGAYCLLIFEPFLLLLETTLE